MKYVAINKKSSVTGKNLAKALNARTINRRRFKFRPSFLIRWGNSYNSPNGRCIELNSKQAVANASNKLLMAKILSSAEGVNFPKVYFPVNGTFPEEVINSERPKYFRNRFNQARKRVRPIEGDLYCVEDVDKEREFRVHIFNGKTIGVYEKVPMDRNSPYWKSEHVEFKRLDMSNKENVVKGLRPMAKAATEALGLLFSGVDAILSTDGKLYINEVNSAPSLNAPNIERWVEAINEYIYETSSKQ